MKPRGSMSQDEAATPEPVAKKRRGFASMSVEKRREIASRGGKAAHACGMAHEFDSSEAREAGRKGGLKVSTNREHMARIGGNGGRARGKKLEQELGAALEAAETKQP